MIAAAEIAIEITPILASGIKITRYQDRVASSLRCIKI